MQGSGENWGVPPDAPTLHGLLPELALRLLVLPDRLEFPCSMSER